MFNDLFRGVRFSFLAALFGPMCLMAASVDHTFILQTFEGTKASILAGRAGDVLPYLDPSLLVYFEKIRNLAVNASDADLAALPILDRLSVTALRRQFTPAQLNTLSASGYVQSALDGGLIKKTDVARIRLGEVAFDDTGTHATAVLIRGDQALPFNLPFVKQSDGRWLIDGMAAYRLAETIARADALVRGETDQAWAQRIAGQIPR